MKKFFLIIFFLAAILPAQTDWVKWNGVQVSYEMKNNNEQKQSVGFLASLQSAYKFLISDHDGDNCPFYPSCSQFYVEAVNNSGFVKGTFMFADRFTRDLNFFKGWKHYPIDNKTGKFFDPSYNYTLNPRTIQFLSAERPSE